jgi:hypothetical protein
MKTLKLLIIMPLIALFVQTVAAKGQIIGLYLTRQDYLDHKLSYGADGDKIKVGGLFETNNVVLIHEGKKQVFSKNEIFGYSRDGIDYRFFNDAEYRILENRGLTIYSRTTLVQQGKGPKPTEQYYFSSNLSSAILPLSIANIENVFAKNQKFVYAVQSLVRNDYDLLDYDSYYKEYKLTYLYLQNAM